MVNLHKELSELVNIRQFLEFRLCGKMITVETIPQERSFSVTGSILLLLYNLLLTSVFTLAVVCAYYFYVRKHDSVFIALGVMFCAYIFDNTIVFCTEVIPEFASLYDKLFLLAPSVKTIYFITLIGGMLYAFQKALNVFTLKNYFIPIALYATVLISAPMIPENNWMVFIYYLPTQLLMAGIALWGMRLMKKSPQPYQEPRFALFRRLLVFLLCLSICVLIEDTIVIFFFDVFAEVGLKINNRNVSENILFLGLAAGLIREAGKLLTVSSKNLSGSLQMSLYAEKPPTKLFCMAYGLTDRESEIFQRLLDGKSQQEISEELIIALGTVKTHIHNVYQKTGASNRNQLIDRYQQFIQRKTAESASAGVPS